MQPVLIVPLGFDVERVAKSIFRSGASRTYLIFSARKSYETYANEKLPVLDSLSKFIKIEEFDEADFTNISDIYRSLTKALYVAKDENPGSNILFDITSTTKECVLAIFAIAQFENLQVTYMPKSNQNDMDKSEGLDKRINDKPSDYGEERIIFNLPRAKGGPISDEEILMLYRIFDNQRYDSMKSLIDDIKVKSKVKLVDRSWIRVLHDLEDRNFVKLFDTGKRKGFEITLEGKGTIQGIREARDYLDAKKSGQVETTIF